MIRFEWTLELCQQEALKYERRVDFLKSCGQAYRIAHKKGWLNDICSHMIEVRKPNRYWSKENCLIEALKHNTKKDFQKSSPSVYVVASRNGWIGDICAHMVPLGHLHQRYLYKISFPDSCIYIGLSWNPKTRFTQHLVKGTVYKHIMKTNIKPTFELVSDTPYSPEEASELEHLIVEEYKKSGSCILNKNKAGGLGGDRVKWTFEEVKKEALKFNSKKEFLKNNMGAYSAAEKKKWLTAVCEHMVVIKRPNNYWTKEKCQEEALKFSSRAQFAKESENIYKTSSRKGWLNEVCSHMIKIRELRGYWTYENCKMEAAKYRNKSQFKTGSSGAYSAAKNNDWLKDLFTN